MLSWAWILPNLATGARINEASDIAKLAKDGVTHILNLCIPEDFDTLAAVAEMSRGIREGGFEKEAELVFPFVYLHNGTPDDGKPKNPEWFEASGEFALPAMAGSGKVYAHCSVGYNRGPSTCYYLLRVLGWTPWQAKKRIWWKRPITLFGGARYIPDAERAIQKL